MAKISLLTKRLLKIALGLLVFTLVSCLLLIAFFILAPSIKSYAQRTPFNSEKWKEPVARAEPIRQKMLPDLLKNHPLIGKTRNEVDLLLGQPPMSSYFKDYDYVYWLGPERNPLGIDSEWLCIKFEDNKVIKADIRTD